MTANTSYRYLLFDHDGVLVDTEALYFEATRRGLALLGVPLDMATYQAHMVRGEACWVLARNRGIPESEIERARRRRNDWYQRTLRERDVGIPGVAEILRRLARHFRMAVVTTSRRADFELIHSGRDLLSHMEFALVREDYTHSKPHPEPYRLALERFGASPREALVIEDSERGLRAAVAAGIDCAIVHNDFTAGQDFSAARYRLDSIEALRGLLLGAGGPD